MRLVSNVQKRTLTLKRYKVRDTHINKMSTLSKIAQKLLNPDIKSQIEAGYLTEDLKLTDAGRLALAQIQYFNDMAEAKQLTVMANDKIAREQAEKETCKK